MQIKFKVSFKNKSIYILIGFIILTIFLFALKYTWLAVISFIYNIYSVLEFETKRTEKTAVLTPEQAKEFEKIAAGNDVAAALKVTDSKQKDL